MKLYESDVSWERQTVEEQNLEQLNGCGLGLCHLRTLIGLSGALDCSLMNLAEGDSS